MTSRTTVQAFWFTGMDNVGDTLTAPLLNHFGYDVELVDRNTRIASSPPWPGCGSPLPTRRPYRLNALLVGTTPSRPVSSPML